MNHQTIQLKIDENTLNKIFKKIAADVGNKIYYNFLMARYLPEIKRAASTFPSVSASLVSNSVSISSAVDCVIIGLASSIGIYELRGF